MKNFYLYFLSAFVFVCGFHVQGQGPCSGTPATNTAVASSTLICSASSITLSLLNAYSSTGITYQWQFSSSQLGPFAPITGATNSLLVTTGTLGTGYYTAVISCGGNTIMAQAVSVSVQPSGFVAGIPYYEGFEGISANNELPNCSWTASNLGGVCRTYINTIPGGFSGCMGSKFAAFTFTPAGTNYFFTNGLQLTAGVHYSASVWYGTGYFTPSSWTDLSLLLNSSQTAVGASTIVSTNGTAFSGPCKNLSGMFTVPTSGVYYLMIRGTSNGVGSTTYLTLDDISVTVPCGATLNTPTISVQLSSPTVCAGQVVSATLTGAHVYNTPLTNSVTSFTLNTSGTINFSGTNTLTGCIGVYSVNISVVPLPNPMLLPNPVAVCKGGKSTLSLFSASDSVHWSTGETGNPIIVSPTVETVYQVTVTNQHGCKVSNSTTVFVYPDQPVGIISTAYLACRGDQVVLTGTGATVYQWLGYSPVQTLSVSPVQNTTYTLLGTSPQGCTVTASTEIQIVDCIGLAELNGHLTEATLYPNPTADEFLIRGISGSYDLRITDQSGRVISNFTKKCGPVVSVAGLPPGIYLVELRSGEERKNLKLIKN